MKGTDVGKQMNTEQADSTRLRAIEKQNGVVLELKKKWQDAKDDLAQARKAFDEAIDTLSDMITPPNEPLLKDEQKAGDAQE